jgi:hypothetical protein
MELQKLILDINKENLNLAEEEKKMSTIELIANVINYVLLSYSQQIKGLIKTEREQVYELNNALSDAVKNNNKEIEIKNTTLGFLRKTFRETKLNPSFLLEEVEKFIDSIPFK